MVKSQVQFLVQVLDLAKDEGHSTCTGCIGMSPPYNANVFTVIWLQCILFFSAASV